MRVYTFRMPKWMSHVTRACIKLVKPSKKSSTKK